jgi:replicative DNA helicase
MFSSPTATPEFEQAVIAAALQDAEARDLTMNLSSSDFDNPDHAHIWEAVQTLHGRGDGVDSMTVCAELERTAHDNLDELVIALARAGVITSNAKTYEKHVRAASRGRKTLAVSIQLGGLAANCLKLEPGEYRERYHTIVQDGLPAARLSAIKRVDLGIQELIVAMESPEPLGVPIYIKSPNIAAAGGLARMLYPGMLSSVAGGSGDGKTMWMTQVAENAAMDGATVAIVDGEIPERQAQARRMQRYTGINSDRFLEQIYAGKSILNAEEWTLVYSVRDQHSAWMERLHYLYTPEQKKQGVWGVIDELRELHRVSPLNLVILDYIQLFAADDATKNEAQAISWAMQSFKNFIGNIGAHGYVGSQFNNTTVKNDRVRTQYGMKGSGDIGAKSNCVITINRPINQDKAPIARHWRGNTFWVQEGERDLEATFRVDKNSFGREGVVCKMFLDGRYWTWRDLKTVDMNQ